VKSLYTQIVIGAIVGFVVAGIFTKLIVSERLEDFKSVVELQQSEQETLLISLAEITSRNGADEVTESVVKDCVVSDRERFDSLLSRLNSGLPLTELNELERLFGRCGSFYAERKTLMVSRMVREFTVYKLYTTQLEALTDASLTKQAQIDKWESLLSHEQTQSQLFAKLVELQGQIIATLLTGKSTESSEIKAILDEVREVQENLQLANAQAASIRSEIISL
jgi:hypothetical protein